MNHDSSVPPPSSRRQPENTDPSQAGHQWNNRITRRSFLKRTGGATLATMVTWHGTTMHSKGEEQGVGANSDDIWGMLCASPELVNSPVIVPILLDIPQAGGGVIPVTVRIEASSSKFRDPQGTEPYNFTSFSGTVSVDVIQGGVIKSFATYYSDYDVYCDGNTGVMSGGASNRPWLEKILTFIIGTTLVSLKFNIITPAVVGQLVVITGVSISGGAKTAEDEIFLFNFDPNFVKIENFFFPKKK